MHPTRSGQGATGRAPSAPLYPVVLDVRARPVLVVGGGPVAARKAAGLAACGAAVTVVAPTMDPALDALGGSPGTVRLLRRRYRTGEVAGYRLAVTATGLPTVDGTVSAEADAAGVWVNSADDAANCSFLLPSVHRDGPVSISVSTAGTSPALATWLRRRIAAGLGPGLATIAALLEEGRARLKAAGRSTEDVDWQTLLDGPLPDLVRAGQLEQARALVREALSDDAR